MSFDSAVTKKSLKMNRSSSLNNSFQGKDISKAVIVENMTAKERQQRAVEVCSFFIIENHAFKSIVESKLNKHATNFFIDLKDDTEILLELIVKLNLANNSIELWLRYIL